MLRYGVDDLRSFFDNDVRFLRQFAWCRDDSRSWLPARHGWIEPPRRARGARLAA